MTTRPFRWGYDYLVPGYPRASAITEYIEYTDKLDKFRVYDDQVYELTNLADLQTTGFADNDAICATIWNWQLSDKGEWVHQYSQSVLVQTVKIPHDFDYTTHIIIRAYIKPADYTFFKIKFSS